MQNEQKKCIMISAGEASGDLHGGNLVNAMRKMDESIFFCGIGGDKLRSAGVRILVDYSELAVMGITEVVSRLPAIFKALATVKRVLKSLKPDLVILIDFADFNLKVAAAAKKLKIPVLYYIAPKVWAWRPGRVKKIKRLTDHAAVILPFEEQFFRSRGMHATFIGHPLLDIQYTETNIVPRETAGSKIIGLLPGSRRSEITRHLPILLESASIMNKQNRGLKFLISVAPSADITFMIDLLKSQQERDIFELVDGGVERIFRQAEFLVAASGTVTLEAALYGIPMVIIYKMSALTYWLARRLAKVDHAGLANLIAEKEIVPELLQNDANPANIANTVSGFLNNTGKIQEMKKGLLGIRERLGGTGASERTATIAHNMINQRYG
ncbi:MAG: lipid-A-disaccharide synthase [Deltaproteobacteria bacterium]|nr:lipid-A-disaccharide synthase [Deltaproteobacteria bacterium]